MSETYELTVSKVISAERKDVFDAWLSIDALKAFIRPGENMSVPRAEVDARVGGEFLIVMLVGDQEMPHRGEYKVIDRYDTLAFTWISGMTIPDSTVTLTFRELGPNQTEVTLHHIGFPNQESRDNHEGGWIKILETQASVDLATTAAA